MHIDYINIHLSIPEKFYDLAYGVLYDFPFSGIEEKANELVVSFESDQWNDDTRNSVLTGLKSIFPDAEIAKEERIIDKNWNEEWEKNVPAIRVSDRIGIAPSWRLDELDTELKITINPKMSFGTGNHCTTRLVSKLLDQIIKPGQYWIDVGTGTGVLAILAVLTGARGVYAFDNNIWAINNAIENINLNGVSDRVEVHNLDITEAELPVADGIAANLFMHLVKPSFPKFRESLMESGGDLLISGILEYDKDEIIDTANDNGFDLISYETEDEWIAFHFRMRK